MSPMLLRVSVELRAEPRYLLGHRLFSSVGEGYTGGSQYCRHGKYSGIGVAFRLPADRHRCH